MVGLQRTVNAYQHGLFSEILEKMQDLKEKLEAEQEALRDAVAKKANLDQLRDVQAAAEKSRGAGEEAGGGARLAPEQLLQLRQALENKVGIDELQELKKIVAQKATKADLQAVKDSVSGPFVPVEQFQEALIDIELRKANVEQVSKLLAQTSQKAAIVEMIQGNRAEIAKKADNHEFLEVREAIEAERLEVAERIERNTSRMEENTKTMEENTKRVERVESMLAAAGQEANSKQVEEILERVEAKASLQQVESAMAALEQKASVKQVREIERDVTQRVEDLMAAVEQKASLQQLEEVIELVDEIKAAAAEAEKADMKSAEDDAKTKARRKQSKLTFNAETGAWEQKQGNDAS